LGLTHQEVAETIGTSRVTITPLLKQLEQASTIRRVRQRLILIDD
jgi:CRP-like cAMP-binding protein